MAGDAVNPGVFVGVDSGGTRTNVQMTEISTDGEESKSRSYEVSESLSGALAADLIPRSLRRILAPLERQVADFSNQSLPVYLWISAAGFSPWTRNQFVGAIREISPELVDSRVVCTGMANDAVTLLLGSRAHGVVIAGTGSSVLVRSPDGLIYQAGGHEWVACDYGSGFWIGLRAIRQAYRDFEDGHESVLLQRMRQVYDVDEDDDRELIEKLRELAVGTKNMKKEVARFAATVCDAAERGDEDAQDIVKLEAEDLADVTAGSLRRRFPREVLVDGLDMVQCGSLLGNSFYRSSYEAQLGMRLLSKDGEAARLNWVRVITGGPSAVRLAQDLAVDSEQLLEVDMAFRPAVVHQ